MIWYSMFYVFGCAFRSWIPRADVQRICLWDTWFSSVFLGRTVATVAELAFVYQWALLLKFYGKETGNGTVAQIGKVVFPIIVVAEVCSWFAVITTNYLGNSIEESLWGFTYSLILIALVMLSKIVIRGLRFVSIVAAFSAFLYVCCMGFVDVPMYVNRFLVDQANGKRYLGLLEGLVDLNSNWVVTHSIVDWRTEIPWQTLYFTFAVLVSISMCYVPLTPEGATRCIERKKN